MSNRLSDDLASLRIEASVPRPSREGGRSWALPLLLVACVAASVVAAPHVGALFEDAQDEPAEPVRAPTEPVTTSAGRVEIVASGYVVPQLTSKVGAKVEGRIIEVLVREGDVVNEGDPLFVLDATRQHALLAAAKARLAAARARAERQRVELAEAKRRLALEQRLLDGGAATRAAVEDLQGQVEVLRHLRSAARAEIAEVEAQVDELSLEIEHRTIRAPIGGTAVTNPADLGEVVSPLLPALLELADFSTLMVEVDVPEGRLGKVQIGGPCTIVLDAHPDREYQGAVAEVSPVINRAKATAITRIRFVGPHEGVLPNMAARVSFIAPPSDGKAQAMLHAPASTVASPPLEGPARGRSVEERTNVR